MKLDSRILEGKKPLTCFDVEEAKKYIGKDCYFASKFERFENLSKVPHATLHNVDDGPVPFQCYDEDGVFCYDCFILPCEWVKPEEPEKKYRPYTVMEFIKEYPLGSHLHFRPKDTLIEMHRLIDGYNDCLNGAGTLFMCGMMYSMSELYDRYEIFKDGKWQPFGVIDE